MNTRFATHSDIPHIANMYDEFKGEEFESFGMKFDRLVTQRSINAMIAHENGRVLVMHTDKTIFGMIAGIISPSITSNSIDFVGCLFFVKAGMRAYTDKFLKEAQRLLKNDATHFILASPAFEEFEKSERFYSISGFKKLETHWVKKL